MKTRTALALLCTVLVYLVAGCVGPTTPSGDRGVTFSKQTGENHLARARANENKMEWDMALDEYLTAAQSLPRDARVHLGLGHCYFQKRVYDLAIEHLDMVIASVLLSMGMMMLPPIMISMPFKLILFVLMDGWHLIVGSLAESFVGG